ncbi:phage holin family protein [Bacillus thuringiensis]|uniref:phage holin family protein n=1 Tax=Bacillus thuringiensis TaxID=1428 RepID=UPI000CFA2D1C|nr:phage holin family protein [Bacillus thuringiensis]PQQ47815.1 holin [Bacillus thuringiensis]
MERLNVIVKAFIATLGGFYGYLFGGWDVVLKVLVNLVVIDYITGVIAAGYNMELKSKKGFKGIAKKLMLFLLVGVANQLDTVLGSNSAIREATIFFFMGNELVSITENAGRMGVPLPQSLSNAVEILGGKSKHEKKEEDDK